MKKLFCVLLALTLCLGLAACGSTEPADNEVDAITVDGQEVSVKDFLIEHLAAYLESETFLQSQQLFREMTDSEPAPFTVTRVIEVEADEMGPAALSVHYLAVKADCQWAREDGLFSDTLLIVDYEDGTVYHESMVDESWMDDETDKDYFTYVMLNGPLCGSGYEGGAILTDAETRTELSADVIGEINSALQK